jgi:TRAP-type C4-dicarboxylate transport system substrate-binding protein
LTLIWWADELKKQTKGQVQVEFFWSQALVKGKETMKAVGSGLIDTGTILGIYTPADLPLWNLANAPFGGRDPWVGMRTWQEMRQVNLALEAETTKKNVKILTNFTTGSVDILSKTPILKAADLAGKKMRLTGGWGPLMQRLGATPVRLGFGEYYQALDKGTVDGGINYIQAVKAYKHYEVAGHVTEVQMGQVLGFGIGINIRTWKSMPKDIQKIVADVSDAYIEKYAEALIKSVNDSRAAMQAGIDGKKVEFHVMDPAEREAWKKESAFFIKDWSEKMTKKRINAEAFLKQLNGIRAKYEAELEEKGYPWTR